METLKLRECLFCLLLILSAACSLLTAQNPYIHQYTTQDGLPSNTVYYIFQDSKKFIWFATDAGVSRYDGTNFTNFRKKDGLSSNEVIRIKEDSFGRIWFFNINSDLDFFYQNKIFNKTNASFLTAIKNKIFFIDFYQDKGKVIYFYNKQFEIYSLDPQNRVKKCGLDEELTSRQMANQNKDFGLRYLCKDSTGELIAWTRKGIFKFTSSYKGRTKLVEPTEIWKVFPGRGNYYYVSAYKNGIFKISGNFQFTPIFPHVQTAPFNIGINSIFEDTGRFLWIVTFGQGVFCLRGNQLVRHYEIEQGQAITEDNEGNIWISSMKDGVYKISPYNNAHMHYETSLFGNMGIAAMDANLPNGLWFTNGKAVYLLKNHDFYTLDYHSKTISFSDVCQLKNNTLIVGEKGSWYFAFDGISMDFATKQISYKTFARTAYLGKKLTINQKEDKIINFFGGSTLFIYSGNQIFRNFKEVNISDFIYNTFYDLRGDLIINARKNFIYRNEKILPYTRLAHFDNKIITDYLIINDSTELFRIEGDSIYLCCRNKFYNLSDAFSHPIDRQVKNIASHKAALYLSTVGNVYKCENPLDVFRNRKVRLRLLDVNFRNIHEVLVFNDSLYIASDDGLTIIPEAQVEKMNTSIPIPYIRSVSVNDQETDPGTPGLTIRGSAKIAFSFGCINYSSAPVLYAYKLDGMDSAWTTATNRAVVYQNLTAGNYTFLLKVGKSTSEWSGAVACPVHIKASIWQHPLFFLFLAIFALMVISLFIMRRKNNQMKRQELDHHLVTLELKSLQSMMNPHFIFNAMGSIQNFLLLNKTGEAGLYLSQFARLIRQNMNAINAAMINLDEEVDRLRNYLDLEKLRMENKFDYLIDVDESIEADDIRIPSMIIQPFVENSIWHGMSALDCKGMVSVHFSFGDEKSLKVIIEDNGIGIKKAQSYQNKGEKHLNLGMEMTRKRLELLGRKYAVKTLVEFSEAQPGNANPGTRVELIIPFVYFDSGV